MVSAHHDSNQRMASTKTALEEIVRRLADLLTI